MAYPSNRPFSEVRVQCTSSPGITAVAVTPAPCNGEIVRVGGMINGAITGGNASVAVAINGVAVGGSPFIITQAASATGTIGTLLPSSPNNVNEDDIISFTPTGATGAAVVTTFFAVIQRNAVGT